MALQAYSSMFSHVLKMSVMFKNIAGHGSHVQPENMAVMFCHVKNMKHHVKKGMFKHV